MTALDPANDRVDVYSKTLNQHAETTPFTLAKAALAAGTGISVTYDPGSGKVTINNTITGGGGGTTYVSARVPYAVAAGTATAIVADYTPDTAALGAGDLISVKLLYTIAGATTLAPDGNGPYPVVDSAGNALTVNFGIAGELLVMEFDGTSLRVLNKQPAAPAPSLQTPGAIGSLAFCRLSTDPTETMASAGYGPGPLAWHLLIGAGPALGYVYGQYIMDHLMTDPSGSGHSSFTGVWRVLSQLPLPGANGTGPFMSLMQRVS